MFYDRRVEQDINPLTQELTVRLAHQVAVTGKTSGRSVQDVAKAGLLAAAAVAWGLREVADLPVEAWTEACRITADPASLTNTTPTLPAVQVLKDRLAATR